MSFIRNGTAPAIAGKPAVGSQPSGMNGMIVTVVRNVPVEPRAPRTPNRLSQNPAYNRAKIVHSDAPKNRAPRAAAGYVNVGRDRIEKNPDQRVRDALQLVFAKFAEFQGARQVHIWLRDEGIELPVKSRAGEARGVVWRLPAYNILHNILTNPIYAGAYAFGRTTSRVSVKGGRKHVRRGLQKPMAEWDVLIKDHYTAYITWDEFEHNLEVIANNATGMSSALARGAARKGDLLLPGLLRCGHCGRKLHVHYSGKIGRYNCYGARTNQGAARCLSIR